MATSIKQPQELPIEYVSVVALAASAVNPRVTEDEEGIATLAASIKAHGVLSPLVARRRDDGSLEVIAGNRRLRAAQVAGLVAVPVIVREADDAEARVIAIVENIEREDLNPLDEAHAYAALVETGLKVRAIARRVAKPDSRIVNLLSLLEMPAPVRDLVWHGHLSPSHIPQLKRAGEVSEAVRDELAEEAAEYGYSVAALSERVDEYLEYEAREQVGRLRREAEDEERRAKVEVRARELEKLRADETLGPVHDQLVEELPWGSFQNLSYFGTLPLQCSEPANCPYGERGTLVDYNGQQVPACFKPDHWRELQEEVRREERKAERETGPARVAAAVSQMPTSVNRQRLVYAVATLVARYADGQLKAWGRDHEQPWSKEKADVTRAERLLPFLESLKSAELTQLFFYELGRLGAEFGQRQAHVRLYAEEHGLLAVADDVHESVTPE